MKGANPIIDRVRRALGRQAGEPVPPRPPIVPPRTPGSPEAELEKLLDEIEALSGETARIQEEDVGASLERLVADHSIERATLWSTPRLNELGVEAHLARVGVEIVPADADKHALARCDLGVTEADFALPETGTLGLLASATKPRAVSLLPRVHLVILSPDALVADLHQVFEQAREHPYLVFIGGPSRTADIELTLTLGVHGPCAACVWALFP